MTYTLDTPLSEAIEAAVEADACEKDIDILRALFRPGMTIGDLINHPNSATWAYWFAKKVIHGRFREAEKTIAQDAMCALHYATDVIYGRFEAGEAEIIKNAYVACFYAIDIIKGRFEAAEAVIATSDFYAKFYSKIPGVPNDWKENLI